MGTVLYYKGITKIIFWEPNLRATKEDPSFHSLLSLESETFDIGI